MNLADVLTWVRHELPGRPELCLVCDVTSAGATVTLCTSRSGVVGVLGAAALAVDDPALRLPAALRSAKLEPARSDPRWRGGVAGWDEHGEIGVGELLDALDRYGARVVAAVRSTLDGDRPGEAPLATVVVGDLAAHLRGGLASLDACGPVVVDGVDRADLAAAARELAATTDDAVADAYPFRIGLRARSAAGDDEQDVVVLVAPEGTLTGSGETVLGEDVWVVPHSTVELVRYAPDPVPVDHPALQVPPPGRYTTGLRLVRGAAELVFQPPGGAEPAVCPVGTLPVGRARRRRVSR